ncbi:MAG: methyltransferase family protein [Anaerolineales bacterium]|jgi:protein-S-isoprenylcysteine O-methyltransferase Ste14
MNEPMLSRGALVRTVLVRFGGAFLVLCAMFFLPAGTLAYWEAWAWMGVLFVPMAGVLVYLVRKDPALLERRMRTREPEKEQSLLIKLSLLWFVLTFLLPGFDRRFGWSDVPFWVVIVADVLVLLSYCLFIVVVRENTYASRVVEVERGQEVISSGPYSIVRHPMYLGVLVMYVCTPLALGSSWALIPAVLIIPVIIARIRNEEKVLQRDLPGYSQYMQTTRFRVVPGVW